MGARALLRLCRHAVLVLPLLATCADVVREIEEDAARRLGGG